jgi:hypothetical protein
MDLKDYRIDLWRFVPAFSHHVLERNRMKRLTCPDCEEAKKFKWIQLQNYVSYCKNKHMPLNGLAEREFEISLDGQSHNVKAMAVFTVHNVAPEETGLYHLDFTVGGKRWKSSSSTRLFIQESEQDCRLSSLLSREMSRPMRDAGSKVGLFLDTEVRG